MRKIHALAVLVLLPTLTWAAVTGEWKVKLLKGSTTIDTPTGATEAEAWAKCQALIPKTVTTQTTYRCQTPVYTAVVTPDAVTCPPPPASTTRSQACPTGTTGSWTQTSTSTVGPPPTCTVTTTWAPSSPPAGACATTSPTTPVLTVTTSPNPTTPANSDLALSWTAVAGTTMYEVERSPAGCASYRWIIDEPGTTRKVENRPPGLTECYRVRAWKPEPSGPFSIGVSVTTPTNQPPPATGSAKLTWTPPTLNTDKSTLTDLAGYRIQYGLAGALDRAVLVSNPVVSTYEVTGLAAGTWSFAVSAVNSAGEPSAPTNQVTKVVP